MGGGIPIIKALRESLVGNKISTVYGILNGTTNFILTRTFQEDVEFDMALKEAQEKGYALRRRDTTKGRKPKLTDIHIAAIFILSYIPNTKVLTLAKLLIDPSIHSWHIFRSYRL